MSPGSPPGIAREPPGNRLGAARESPGIGENMQVRLFIDGLEATLQNATASLVRYRKPFVLSISGSGAGGAVTEGGQSMQRTRLKHSALGTEDFTVVRALAGAHRAHLSQQKLG